MKVISLLLLIIGLLVISNTTFQDALDAEALYVDNFCNGYWPDYKNLKPDCRGR